MSKSRSTTDLLREYSARKQAAPPKAKEGEVNSANVKITTDANELPKILHTDAEVVEGKRLADLILSMIPEKVNINTAHIVIDYSYQPDLERARVKNIADNWNAALYRPGVLNEREDGSLAVVDGQHTYTAARLRAIPYLLFTVYRGENRLSHRQEAVLLRELNARKNRRAPSKPAERRAEIASGSDIGKVYKGIDAILAKVGFHHGGKSAGRVNSLGMLVESYKLDGTGDALEKALWCIKRAWGNQQSATGVMVRAIAGLFHNDNGLINEQELAEVLHRWEQTGKGLETWTQAVKAEYGSKPTCRFMPYCLAERVLYHYNFRRTSKRLPQSALDGFTKPGDNKAPPKTARLKLAA